MSPDNVVTGIHSKRGSKRREIELDGSIWIAVPRVVLAQLDITSGDHLDTERVTARIAKLERPAARERAVRLLAYRDRSESEMRKRLTDDGYSRAAVDETLEWLLCTGLIDDERFAEQLARTLITGRRYGRVRALQKLQRAGVSDEIAQASIDALAPEDEERDRAVAFARRLHRVGDSVDLLAARLVRRGYGVSDSLAAARVVVDEGETIDGIPEDDF